MTLRSYLQEKLIGAIHADAGLHRYRTADELKAEALVWFLTGEWRLARIFWAASQPGYEFKDSSISAGQRAFSFTDEDARMVELECRRSQTVPLDN